MLVRNLNNYRPPTFHFRFRKISKSIIKITGGLSPPASTHPGDATDSSVYSDVSSSMPSCIETDHKYGHAHGQQRQW